MSGAGQAQDASGTWGWRAVKLITVLVYFFLFAPIAAVVILSFNASMFGGFPMTGVSLQWYAKLFDNEIVLRSFKTSIWIAVVTALVCTLIGILAALALTRYEFRAKQWMNTVVVLPALVPETILGVGVLLFLKWMDQPRTYLVLVLGHIMLALPFVVLVVQARLIGIKRIYEEASLSLGAGRFATFREVTLPLLTPAIVAALLLVFTISFDNITASLFWLPPGVQTMPSQILAMLRMSISPEINAFGSLMVLITVGVPLLCGLVGRALLGRNRL